MRRAAYMLVALAACKHDERTAPTPSASVSALLSPSGSASAAATAPVTAGPINYTGSYVATPGTLFVPDAAPWGGVKFRGDDAGDLGEGTLALTIESDGGALTGELQGPLGPATLSGFASDGSLSFHVSPRAATDMAFSGTGTGSIDGGAVSGELHLSSWRANVLRDATFHATRK